MVNVPVPATSVDKSNVARFTGLPTGAFCCSRVTTLPLMLSMMAAWPVGAHDCCGPRRGRDGFELHVRAELNDVAGFGLGEVDGRAPDVVTGLIEVRAALAPAAFKASVTRSVHCPLSIVWPMTLWA